MDVHMASAIYLVANAVSVHKYLVFLQHYLDRLTYAMYFAQWLPVVKKEEKRQIKACYCLY